MTALLDDLEIVWQETLKVLRPQMTRATYDTILIGTSLVELGENSDSPIIEVKTDMAKEWLENRLKDYVKRALSSIIQRPISSITFQTNGNGNSNGAAGHPAITPPSVSSEEITTHSDSLVTTSSVAPSLNNIDGAASHYPAITPPSVSSEEITTPSGSLTTSSATPFLNNTDGTETTLDQMDLSSPARPPIMVFASLPPSEPIKALPTVLLVEEPYQEAPEEVLTPGQIVARANYVRGYLEGDKATKTRPTGYSQVPHPVSQYGMPLVGGPAFSLYGLLCSYDRRSLKDIAPNFWSPPLRFSFQILAEKMNKSHHRYISGDTHECDYSRQARKKGQPLRSPEDCCHSCNFEFLRFKPHPKGGLQCLHWVLGLLEKLCEVGWICVEIRPGEYKPIIWVWRMAPPPTPHEYRLLSPELQSSFDDWLIDNGHLFNIPNREFWNSITEPHLAPLMPGYINENVKNNWFEEYKKRREFFDNAVKNPNFNPEDIN